MAPSTPPGAAFPASEVELAGLVPANRVRHLPTRYVRRGPATGLSRHKRPTHAAQGIYSTDPLAGSKYAEPAKLPPAKFGKVV